MSRGAAVSVIGVRRVASPVGTVDRPGGRVHNEAVRSGDGPEQGGAAIIDASGDGPPLAQPAPAGPVDLTKVRCEECGLTFAQFRRSGRLGCPNDYAVFAELLGPLALRVHRTLGHPGKRPVHDAADRSTTDEMRRLRARLRCSVAAERFEEAAELRDRLGTLARTLAGRPEKQGTS